MIDVKATLRLWHTQLMSKPLRYRWLAAIEAVLLGLVAPLDAKIASWFEPTPPARTHETLNDFRKQFNPLTPAEDIFLVDGSQPMTGDIDMGGARPWVMTGDTGPDPRVDPKGYQLHVGTVLARPRKPVPPPNVTMRE